MLTLAHRSEVLYNNIQCFCNVLYITATAILLSDIYDCDRCRVLSSQAFLLLEEMQAFLHVSVPHSNVIHLASRALIFVLMCCRRFHTTQSSASVEQC